MTSQQALIAQQALAAASAAANSVKFDYFMPNPVPTPGIFFI